MQDGEQYLIMASKEGQPTNPDWYYNLVANPDVSVEVGTEKFEALARVTDGSERTELFDKMSTLYPNFAEYQEKTTRVIPVISITRRLLSHL